MTFLLAASLAHGATTVNWNFKHAKTAKSLTAASIGALSTGVVGGKETSLDCGTVAGEATCVLTVADTGREIARTTNVLCTNENITATFAPNKALNLSTFEELVIIVAPAAVK